MLELWYRNPVDCIWELMGNPMFHDVMKYAPEKMFANSKGSIQIINEMWTALWWWELQKYLPAGATIVPTKLSQFQGDKSAWPVYLTIGNISKDVRRDVSSHATILVGYLPVGKFDCYTDKAHQVACYRTFHYAMEIITQSLGQAGKTDIPMTCSDGQERWTWTDLAAYIAGYPEQCLIACCKENRCPICTVAPDRCGSHSENTFRTPNKTLEMIDKLRNGASDPAFNEEWANLGIRPVDNPFWWHLPFSNIFQSFTPNLLHQLHKGVFKDHLVKWCMPGHPGLHHFKNGISTVSQWTGAEHKAMEQVFIGLLAGAVDSRVLMAVRAAIDFIYLASLHSHTSKTLAALSQALDNFHHASNNRDYTVQMTTWLRHQEAIDRFTAYLHWCRNRAYLSLPTIVDEDGIDGDIILPPTNIQRQNPLLSSSQTRNHCVTVALTHPQDLCHIPASKLVEGHNAQCFLNALHLFLCNHGSLMVHKVFDTFNLCHRLTVQLPVIPEAGAKPRDLKNIIPGEAAHLDFTLIQTGERNDRTKGTALEGLHVAHICVLFALPDIFGIAVKKPLAYVEWFTPFSSLNAQTNLYVLTCSMRSHWVYAEIIEADRITNEGHSLDYQQCPRLV
ncbi:hypothetical protein EDD85DRAFT_922575 [Armillaria nabsnona]|nr:hypothetical protein EDD85DRAFT_922575 [Armillaria nabsnona]